MIKFDKDRVCIVLKEVLLDIFVNLEWYNLVSFFCLYIEFCLYNVYNIHGKWW